jgi:pimeloyl-ACP methyl ester carboxylesterase
MSRTSINIQSIYGLGLFDPLEKLMLARDLLRHSRLYYRNTLIVWVMTIIVLWTALSTNRNWLSMLIALVGLYLCSILWLTYKSVHPGKSFFRCRISHLNIDLEAEKVKFLSRDGLQLYGWFLKGEKQPVVILLHRLGATSLSMSCQARLCQKAGYNVLMFDFRAHGDSQGDTITGEMEINDVFGALDYLASRPDVDANQVGILGVHYGAVIALYAASQSAAIKAVVLESIGPATLTDHGGRPETLRRWIIYPFNWLLYSLFDFMSGVERREGVVELLHLIYPRPVLFISTGRGKEQYFVRRFFDAARHPKTLLDVPHASRGIAASVDYQTYQEKVLTVLARAFRDDR